MDPFPVERPTNWQRWTRMTTYPLIWVAAYVLWLLFAGAVLFRLVPTGDWRLGLAAFLGTAAVPFLLIAASNRMLRSNDPDRLE